jgi:hypothetical protein
VMGTIRREISAARTRRWVSMTCRKGKQGN